MCVVIFRMQNVPSVDQTGMYALEDAILELDKKDITVIIVGIQEQPLFMLKNIDLIPALVSKDHLFDEFSVAIKELEQCQLNFQADIAGKTKRKILWSY